MTVPDFQSLMLPLLRLTADGSEHRLTDLKRQLADELRLSEGDLAQRLASGRSTFSNRVEWAFVHLVRGGVIQRPSRGVGVISARGRELLDEGIERLDMRVLQRFPEYASFRKKTGDAGDGPVVVQDTVPPDEEVERLCADWRSTIAQEILATVKTLTPAGFEKLVVDVLVQLGYGALGEGRHLGRSGDGGVDGIITEDKLGLDVIYVQAKRWEGIVGRPQVAEFAGSLDGFRARKGVFITTSSFTSGARDYVAAIEKRIVLIDGQRLSELMYDADVGVTTQASYRIKRVDSDYFVDSA